MKKNSSKKIEEIILASLRKILNLKNIDDEKIKKIKQTNVKIWDSLNHVNIIVDLEKKFKIRFTDDENLDLDSYKKIFVCIKKKLKDQN